MPGKFGKAVFHLGTVFGWIHFAIQNELHICPQRGISCLLTATPGWNVNGAHTSHLWDRCSNHISTKSAGFWQCSCTA